MKNKIKLAGKKPWLPLFLCLILFLACGFSYAQGSETGKYDALAQKVEKKISSEKKVEIEGLKVSNEDGVITIEGVAKLLGSRVKAGNIAAKMDGVKKVNNQIAVTTGDVQDGEIEAEIIAGLRSDLYRGPFDLLSVKSNHGFVHLQGIVRDTTLIEKAYQRAIWTRGVREVQNDIKPASISAGDERLRAAIYNRLRAEFPLYFSGNNQQIIIIVENGRVALFGTVNSPVEKQKIDSLIRSLNGVLSLNDQLQAH
jgi:hyperosmotically inducible periplasmic protein